MNKRQGLLRCAEQDLGSTASRSDGWIDQELADCKFRDVRMRLSNHMVDCYKAG